MKINREDFLNDLNMVKGGLSPRDFVEQSSCFCFSDGQVMTFNDEVACRKEIGFKITGAIQATSLLDILGKLDDPELLVRENEKGELEFRGKKKGFGVTKDAEIFLPIDRVETPDKWKTLPKEFTEAVGLVQHCASIDQSKFLLTCIHISPTFIEACDNHQVLRVKVDTGLSENILVRGTSLQQLVTLGMDKMALTKSWIHFKNQQGLIFSCRRYMEDYPVLDKILKMDGHSIVIPKGMVEAADRASVFAMDKSGDPLVSVSLSNGRIKITGEGLTGWYKEVKKISYEGPALDFLMSPELLKHIADRYQEATIGETKLKVVGGSWCYVTVLGRPNEKTEDGADEEEDEPAPAKSLKKQKDEDVQDDN